MATSKLGGMKTCGWDYLATILNDKPLQVKKIFFGCASDYRSKPIEKVG
jgi:hypothetical protein